MSQADPLIDALVARFPRLFRGRSPRVPSSLPKGWRSIVDRLFEDLDAMLDDPQANIFTVIQIKEKFAGLRVYWSLGDEEMAVVDLVGADGTLRLDFDPDGPTTCFSRISGRVRAAEEESASTCQNCGRSGAEALPGGWLVTLCDRCRAIGPQEAS